MAYGEVARLASGNELPTLPAPRVSRIDRIRVMLKETLVNDLDIEQQNPEKESVS